MSIITYGENERSYNLEVSFIVDNSEVVTSSTSSTSNPTSLSSSISTTTTSSSTDSTSSTSSTPVDTSTTDPSDSSSTSKSEGNGFLEQGITLPLMTLVAIIFYHSKKSKGAQ